MYIQTLFICLSILIPFNSGINSADTQRESDKISLKIKNEKLSSVLQTLEKKSSCKFFYFLEDIAGVEIKDMNFENEEIASILSQLLKNTSLEYEQKGHIFYIRKTNTKEQIHKDSLKIRGQVFDEKLQPMPGVSVRIEGTAYGASTDINGKFELYFPYKTQKLVFTFIGYTTQTITATIGKPIRIEMQLSTTELDESVVVAYGNVKKRDLTGSVSVVKADEIKEIPSVSVANLLQGRIAGMDVTNMSGSPGGGGTVITIRGFNSLGVEQERRYSDPLWVVDGVPLFSFTSPITGTNLLCDLNPAMIESVEVLKDASAAAIYGSRAANGVIMVTTKRGKKGEKPTVTANVSQTWGIVPEFPTVTIGNGERRFRLKQMEEEYSWKYNFISKTYERHPLPKGKIIPDIMYYPTYLRYFIEDSLNPFWNNATNFFPIYYGTGKVTNANIQSYGGSEKIIYGTGVGYYSEKGVFRGTGFDRVDVNGQFGVVPEGRFHIDLRVSLSLIKRKRAESGIGMQNNAPILETVPGDPYELSSLMPGKGTPVWDNILKKLREFHEKNTAARMRANFKITYNIRKDLYFSTMGALDYSINRRNTFIPDWAAYEAGGVPNYNMSVGETGINLMGLSENIFTYKKTFKDIHNIDLLAGGSIEYNRTEYNGAHAQDLPSDQIYYASGNLPDKTANGKVLQRYRSGMQEKRLHSFFGRAEYNYKHRYYVSLSFRRDGSSVFGENNRWGNFPAAALAYTFSEEPFFKNNCPWLDFGKIRASRGRSGMQFYHAYRSLGIMEVGPPYIDQSTLIPNWDEGLYNKDLSWEETDQYDIGFDLNLFENRLRITSDYYYRYTDKLLTLVALPGEVNGYINQWRNAAAISNAGIEFLIKYEIFRRPDLYWKLSVNGAKNKNRYEKSYTGRDDRHGVIGKPLNQIYTFKTCGQYQDFSEFAKIYHVDGSTDYLSFFWGTRFQEGDYKIWDANNDDRIDENDYIASGSALPKFSGGILNEFSYKGFDLNLLLTFQLGRHIIYEPFISSFKTYVDNVNYKLLNHPLLFDIYKQKFWEKPGDSGNLPSANSQILNCFMQFYNDYNVEKVNWLKIKTLTLGYTLPKFISKKLFLEDIRMFVSCENLWTFSNYSGVDPESVDIATGIDYGKSYPLARKLTLGLTLNF